MIKNNEVLIHECSKHGNILWKNPPKCISGKLGGEMIIVILMSSLKNHNTNVIVSAIYLINLFFVQFICEN